MKAKILLAAAAMLMAGAVQAQSTGTCPTLPANSGLAWDTLIGPEYTFCKAIREDDGRQVLAVMITTEAPFRPKRGNRVQATVIDGIENWWYQSELSGTTGVEVRETLVELDRDHVAHISMRGTSQDDLADGMSLAEALRFDDVRLSIN